MKIAAAVILLSLVSVTSYSQQTKFKTLDGKPPIVIGHRGAAGYLPEHTLEGYRLAIKQGVDIIEPDLVMTKDGVFIARHEPMLGGTTDIATKFPASRRTTRLVDGVSVTDYFASDFTLAEIKTLRAIQSNSARSQEFNGLYAIPTLSEIIKVVENERTSTGRVVGLYPEVKHSTFHAAIFGAHVFEDKLLKQLHAAFGNKASAPVFIQSFEVSNLQYLHRHTNIRLVQLIDGSAVANDGSVTSIAPSRQPFDFVANHDSRTYADLLTPDGLRFVKTYANGICPWKPYLVRTVANAVEPNDGQSSNANRRVVGSTGVIEAAHATGLFVHAFTFRNDSGINGFPDGGAEMWYYYVLGLDGLFTDFADTGVAARDAVVSAVAR